MHQQVVTKAKRNGGGVNLGMALMMANTDEWLGEEKRLTKNDRVLTRQKQDKKSRQSPDTDPGVLGFLDPEKILLVKEFLREKRGVQDDTIVCGDDCGGLSLLSTTDLAELRQILCA